MICIFDIIQDQSWHFIGPKHQYGSPFVGIICFPNFSTESLWTSHFSNFEATEKLHISILFSCLWNASKGQYECDACNNKVFFATLIKLTPSKHKTKNLALFFCFLTYFVWTFWSFFNLQESYKWCWSQLHISQALN